MKRIILQKRKETMFFFFNLIAMLRKFESFVAKELNETMEMATKEHPTA